MRAGQPAEAPHDLDAVGLLQRLDAADQLLDLLVLVGCQPVVLERQAVGDQAEVAAVPGLRVDLRAVQQRLGGDAAPVQAGAAQLARLDQRRLQSVLRAAYRAFVAARTAAEHRNVILISHVHTSVRRRKIRLVVYHHYIMPGWGCQS